MSATATSYAAHVDSTIESVEKHVKEESTSNVSTSISSWIKTLSEHEELKDIATDLEQLKAAISEKDGKKIVDLMTKLGAATTKAAEGSEDKDADKFKLLGKALTSAAKAIKKFA